VFVGRYGRDARPLGPPTREKPEAALASLPPDSLITGDGARRYGHLIRERLPRARVVAGEPFLAATLGRLAEAALSRGEGVDAAALRPLYLRDADVRPSRP
jgi:hypothetical protein